MYVIEQLICNSLPNSKFKKALEKPPMVKTNFTFQPYLRYSPMTLAIKNITPKCSLDNTFLWYGRIQHFCGHKSFLKTTLQEYYDSLRGCHHRCRITLKHFLYNMPGIVFFLKGVVKTVTYTSVTFSRRVKLGWNS